MEKVFKFLSGLQRRLSVGTAKLLAVLLVLTSLCSLAYADDVNSIDYPDGSEVETVVTDQSSGESIDDAVPSPEPTEDVIEDDNQASLLSLDDSDFMLEDADVTKADIRTYLSDMTPVAYSVGWGSLCNDIGLDGQTISLNISDGNGGKVQKYFNKGVVAHASSYVRYDLYDSTGKNPYNYFHAYIGVDASKNSQSSVSFVVYGIKDGDLNNTENWVALEMTTGSGTTVTNSPVLSSSSIALEITADISDYRYIQLSADKGASDAYDHATYAGAVLYSSADVKDLDITDIIKPVDYYTKELNKELVSYLNLDPNSTFTTDAEYAAAVANCTTKYSSIATLLSKSDNDKTAQEKEIEMLTLRRSLIEYAGYDKLVNSFLSGNNQTVRDRYDMLAWLMGYVSKATDTVSKDDSGNIIDACNLEPLREFIAGGAPDGGSSNANYINALKVLSRLFAKHKEDLEDTNLRYTTQDKYPGSTTYKTRGTLYRTMMFSLALTHDRSVTAWLNIATVSDPVERYEIFKNMYSGTFEFTSINSKNKGTKYTQTGLLRNSYFESLTVEEMRFVMGNRIYDDELKWLNIYCRAYVENTDSTNTYYVHRHLSYGKNWYHESYGYMDEDNYNNIYSPKYLLSENGVSYSKKDKLWMVMESEHICWGISYTGTNFATAFGVPSHYVLQPGHAAFFKYEMDSQGRGTWGIDNNISGWLQTRMSGTVSGDCNRMLCDWSRHGESWVGDWNGSFILLSTHALNNYDKYEKAETLITLASHATDETQKIELYNAVLEIMPYHMEAWYKLVLIYQNKTATEIAVLSKRLTGSLGDFPMPMHQLLNLLTSKIGSVSGTDAEQLASVSTNEQIALLKASNKQYIYYDGNEYGVGLSQPSLTTDIANYYLGRISNKLATFSFDGDNANCLVFGSSYSGVRFRYSLDGGETWTASGAHTTTYDNLIYKFSDDEISKITAEKDILIWLEGWSSSLGDNAPEKDTAFRIDIYNGSAVSGIEKNDYENCFYGDYSNLEYCRDGESEWHDLTSEAVKFDGSVTVYLRKKASGCTLTGSECKYTFTNNSTDKRSYIPFKNLSLVTCSSEETGHNDYAKYCLDGRFSTRWHTRWDGKDSQKYIVIENSDYTYFSGLDYIATSGDNGTVYACEVYVSADGVNWTLAGTASGWPHDHGANAHSVYFAHPVYGKYVKFKATSTYGSFASATSIELFEDTTLKGKNVNGIEISDGTSTVVGGETYTVSSNTFMGYAGQKVDYSALFSACSLKTTLHFEGGSTGTADASQLSFSQNIFNEAGEHDVSVSYADSQKITLKITIAENPWTATSIKIESAPSTTTYWVGDTVDTTGLSISATDGSHTWYPSSGYTVSALTDDIGTQKVTVTYQNQTAQFDVTVKKVVKSIAVTTDESFNDTYTLGESFDTTGMTVTATYSDDSTNKLDADEYFIPSEVTFAATPGDKDVEVVLRDKSTDDNKKVKTTVAVSVFSYFIRDGVTYEVDVTNNTCVVTAVASGEDFINIPQSVTVVGVDYTVVGIYQNAFDGTEGVTSVALPGTITSIGDNAFTGCDTIDTIYFTAHESFDRLTVSSSAIDPETKLVLYAATEALTSELKQKEFVSENVVVNDVQSKITGLEIVSPTKTEYSINDKADLDGMVVYAVVTETKTTTGENGAEVTETTTLKVPIAPSTYTVSDIDTSKAYPKPDGQSVTVTLNDNTKITNTFTIFVKSVSITISQHPIDNRYTNDQVSYGQVTPLTVIASADGKELTYQWYLSSDSTLDPDSDTKLDGATSNEYTPAKAGYYYVKISVGGISRLSMAANITVGDFVATIGKVGYESLKAAVDAASNGAVITLLKDVEVGETITVNKNITITGAKSGVTADENSQPSDLYYTIKRTTPDKVFNLSGAGVLATKNVIIDGGAVWGGDVNAQLNRGTSNSGLKASNPLMYLADNSAVYLNEGTYVQNIETTSHGAVAYMVDTASFIVNGATIQNCAASSTGYGGVVWNEKGGKVTIKAGTFIGNFAKYGGVISTNSYTAQHTEIYNGTFKYNKAEYGGVVFIGGSSTLTIYDGTFENNYATEGAVVYNNNNGGIHLNGGTYSNNTASANGGVVYDKGSGTINMTGIICSNNTAKMGGVLFLNGSGTVNVYSGEYTENSANNTENSAASFGGVIMVYDAGKVNVFGGTFTGNTSSNLGGVISTNRSSAKEVYVSGGTFTGNSAKYGGAIVIGGPTSLKITGGTFINNTAQSVEYSGNKGTHYGGAICTYNGGTHVIEGGIFECTDSSLVTQWGWETLFGRYWYSSYTPAITITGGTYTTTPDGAIYVTIPSGYKVNKHDHVGDNPDTYVVFKEQTYTGELALVHNSNGSVSVTSSNVSSSEASAAVNELFSNTSISGFHNTNMKLNSDTDKLKAALKAAVTSTVEEAKQEETSSAIDSMESSALLSSITSKIIITPVSVSVDSSRTVHRAVFDVTPTVTTTVNNETVTAELPDEAISDVITFRLPVDSHVDAGTLANVYHEGTLMYTKAVQTGSDGAKYIEIRAKEFSQYSYELTTDVIKPGTYEIAIALASSIDIRFYLQPGDGTSIGDYTVKARFNSDTPTVVSYSDSSNEKYCYNIASAAASQMCDKVYVTVLYKGNVIQEFDYSVKDYCENQIASIDAKDTKTESDSKLRDLCVATLEYGARAQLQFKYKTDLLANANYNLDLTTAGDSLDVVSPVIDGTCTGITPRSCTMVLNSCPTLRFYFTIPGDDISSYSFKYISGKYEDNAFVSDGTGEIKLTPAKKTDTIYYVDISSIASNQLEKAFKVTATNGTDSVTVTYSPKNYFSSKWNNADVNLSNLVKAMHLYYLKACTYFTDN